MMSMTHNKEAFDEKFIPFSDVARGYVTHDSEFVQ